MKTPIKIYLTAAAFITASAFMGCSNSKTNNASYEADTANKAAIAHKDTTADGLKADTAKKKLDDKASKFLVKGCEANMYVIELGEMAGTHATNADVKAFGVQIATTHKALNTDILKQAFNASFKLPGGIDTDHAKKLKDLDKKKGADFDKAFLSTATDAIKKTADDYGDAHLNLPPSSTKDLANAAMGKLVTELNNAATLQGSIK
ncbi:putative outer membrane protein [Mucilaginibacter yixingensis]|uniref:Putative outer membrane protein n=1 Tax=Mucilaginibacter yixingensis TaxID=1295612 RepID=A0A2T5J7C5_9SPHI|nr:DUF4142 domain-containing protein [Mucilaginibacter yixingensis]PTQ95009.1 putative outer membrane protein [Mucilaginibacter yixingensis]